LPTGKENLCAQMSRARSTAERVGAEAFEQLVTDLAMPLEFGPEHISHFIDWNRNELYQVVRGEGECAV